MTIAELFYAKQAQRAMLWPLRRRRPLPRRRKLLLEPLEARLLLTATPFTYAAASGAPLDLTLHLDETTPSAPVFQLIDNSGNTVAQQALADTSRVVITGSGQNDKIAVDFSTPFSVPVVISGTVGDDTLDLSGVTADLAFTIHAGGTVSVTDGSLSLNLSASGIESIKAGSGDNRFVFDVGAAFSGTIDGGTGGTNTLDYFGYTTGVTVNLASGLATGTAGVSHIQNVTGGMGNDILIGDSEDNILIGGYGDDVLVGGAGDDELVGGAGIDTVSYADAISGVTVDLSSKLAQDTGGAGVDKLSEIENLIGSSYNDLLTGSSENNRIEGMAGDDTLIGGAGDDLLIGGAGSDTVSYAHDAAFVTGDLGQNKATDGSGNTDTFASIENLIGSQYDDVLYGDAGPNRLTGGPGNDKIYGGGGADTYVFGNEWGTDTVADDQLLPHDGIGNVLDFSGVTTALIFTIHADGTVSVQDGVNSVSSLSVMPADILNPTDGTSRLAHVNLVGAVIGGSGDDTFTFEDGASFAGSINGGLGRNMLDYSLYTGDVTVNLAGGTATGVTGGISNIQAVELGQGSNNLAGNGGASSDTASYANSSGSVSVDLSTGTVIKTNTFLDTLLGFNNIEGSDYGDHLVGNDQANIIDGGAGVDYLAGGAGDDTYKFRDGWGKDTVIENAGEGTDILDFSGVTADLTFTIHADNTVSVTDGINVLTKTANIERIIDGQGNDTFIFEDGAVFNGEIGASSFWLQALGLDASGGGTNTLDFSAYTTAISVDLGLTIPLTGVFVPGEAHKIGGSGDAIINAIYNIQNVIGGAGNDQIWGNSEANVLMGGAGDDIIDGRDGSDTLIGGAGNDTLKGGLTLNPLVDFDTASYADATAGVHVDLSIIGQQDTIGAGQDTLVGIVNLIGSAHDDVLTGNALNNYLFGGDGNDTLNGGLGADSLEGGLGNNILDGGGNGLAPLFWDMASYAHATAGVHVDLSIAVQQDTIGAGKDTLINIQGIEGSVYNDILRGNDSDNYLTGNAGDDILEGGLGNNFLQGGEGLDTVSYAHATAGVTVDLRNPLPQNTIGAGTDVISGIENLTGSDFADTLTGDLNANVLTGGLGNDILNGKEGSDTYVMALGWTSTDQIVDDATINIGVNVMPTDQSMGVTDTLDFSKVSSNLIFTIHADGSVSVTDGTNTLSNITNLEALIGGTGENRFVFENGAVFTGTINGGSGSLNTLDYSAFSTAVTVDLSAMDDKEFGKAQGTSGARNIHNVTGGAGDDDIRGNSLNNVLIGNAGNDRLEGGGGANTLYGGDGNDTLLGGLGNDKLDGGLGNDTLEGGAGDDTLIGGTGDDILKGDAGSDTASYADASAGVSVNLGITQAQNTLGAGKDTLVDIENLTGTDHDDILIGNDEANVLIGGKGNDELYGRKGDDTLQGGAGDDRLDGAEGNDTASYADAVAGVTVDLNIKVAQVVAVTTNPDNASMLLEEKDTLVSISDLTGSNYADILKGNDDANVISGGGGNDTLFGQGGDDALFGGDGVDALHGGLGDDLLDGGAGNDYLYGDEGDDILEGGDGALAANDLLDGGSGTDTVAYLNANAGVTVSLSDQSQQNTGGGGRDTITNIENLTGSYFDDTLIGDANDNSISGLAGNDILAGGAGNDTLDGGEGVDTATYRNDTGAGVLVNLGEGTASDGFGANDSLSQIENVEGSDGNDILIGDSGDNILIGGLGNDRLDGGDGSDTLSGGTGTNVLIGGGGNDTASYATAGNGVTVDLTKGAALEADAIAQDTGGAGIDKLVSIENLTGSDHEDTLTGDAAANILLGGKGDDTLFGGAGNDILMGGAGNDTIDGGTGNDTASYADEARVNGVSVDLNLTGSQLSQLIDTVSNETETLTGIENLIGSEHNDTLEGDDNANILSGKGGDDYLLGHAGDDVLDGGAGDDILVGGTGSDTVSFADATAGVMVDLNSKYGQDTVGAGIDLLVEIENLQGSDFNDILTGNDAANILDGGAGDDILIGGIGADTLIGGAGDDTASYVVDGAGVIANLALGMARDGYGDMDTFQDVENLVGSDYNDTLTGNDTDNLLDGGGGNDTIKGGAGNDTLIGGEGNDRLEGEAGDDLMAGGVGNDILIGGVGSDTVTYEDLLSGDEVTGVTVDLTKAGATEATSTAQNTVIAGTDTLVSIENLTGSLYNDTLTGDASDNVLSGLDGDDILHGLAGDDTLVGGAGDDIIDGGTGNDTVSYVNAGDGVTVDLNNTTAQNTVGDGSDTLTGIENLTGSGFDDTLIGDANNNLLSGGGGDDLLQGGAGDDILLGGLGNDLLQGGTGSDTASYADAISDVKVSLALLDAQSTGGAGDDTLTDIENLTGSDFDDTLTGNSGNNFIQGGQGNDLLRGAGGDDTLDGGEGSDFASYSEVTAAAATGFTVTVDLNTIGAQFTGTATGWDTLTKIENLIGSAFNDKLSGNALDNIIDGGNGDDLLDGRGGSDTVSYANAKAGVVVDLSLTTEQNTVNAGVDTLTGFENIIGSNYDDLLIGNSGDNLLYGGLGDDTLMGGLGNDTLNGGFGINTADYRNATSGVTVDLTLSGAQDTGGAGIDTLTDIYNLSGSEFSDTLTGDDGNNMLIGRGGNDFLYGGAGVDTLLGGAGDDTLDGGDGNDTASYEDAATGVTVNLATGVSSGGGGNDILVKIENLIGSLHADTLTGDANRNILIGLDGIDTLSGGAGDDLLDGGLGDDILVGGGGNDTATYADASSGVTVNLATGVSSGGAGSDTLTQISNVEGSKYDDTLIGGPGTNRLYGGAGNDRLEGGGGADFLYGDGGDDTLLGNGGDDLLDGGQGSDTASYADATGGVTVNLNLSGTAQNTISDGSDTLNSIENLTGSAHDDTLIGDGSDNVIIGGLGDDYLDGGDGRDTVSYADATADGLVVALNDSRQNTVVMGGDTLHNFENLRGSRFNDTLTGDDHDNMLFGGDGNDHIYGLGGNDYLEGGAGDDTLDGGSGSDTASYLNDIAGVTANLGSNSATDGFGNHDSLTGIENLLGSAYDDTLIGDIHNNMIYGGGGNDYMRGGGGSDILAGGTGNDAYEYSGATQAITIIDPDSYEVTGDMHFNGGITIISGHTITVKENVTISTRDISGSDQLDSPSIGDSGNIFLRGQEIVVNSNARLLSHVEAGSSFAAGNISLDAKDTTKAGSWDDWLGNTSQWDTPQWIKDTFFYFLPLDFENASVSLDSAVIKGGNIAITAEAGQAKLFEDRFAQCNPAVAVDVARDTIRFDSPHHFVTGDVITYDAGTSTAIGGLKSGADYYAVVIDAMTIQLAATKVQAVSANPIVIDLTSTAAGSTHTFAATSTNNVVTDILNTTGSLLGFGSNASDALTTEAFKAIDTVLGTGAKLIDTLLWDLSPLAISSANATVVVGENTVINGSTLDLEATALTNATIKNRYMPIWASVGVSLPTARVLVESGAVIETTGSITMSSQAGSTVSVACNSGSELVLDKVVLDAILAKPIDKFLKYLPAIITSVGVGVAEATTTIAAGATVTAGGSLEVTADVTKVQAVSASASAEILALGTAVSVFSGKAHAIVAGNVTATNDITIRAEVHGAVDADTQKVLTNKTSAFSGTGPGGFSQFLAAFKKEANRNPEGKNSVAGGVALSGSTAVHVHIAESLAEISDNATVLAKHGDIIIEASSREKPQIFGENTALSDTTKIGGNESANTKNVTLSGSVTAGIIINTATARIGKNSTVDAGGSIRIASETALPWDQTWIRPEKMKDLAAR